MTRSFEIRQRGNTYKPLSSLFALSSGLVDGWLLQGQTCARIQNHGRLHEGTELCSAPVAPPLGRNRSCGLQWISVLQQAPE